MSKTKIKSQVILTYDENKDKTTIETIGEVDAVLLMDMIHDGLHIANKRFDKWVAEQRKKRPK